MIRNQIQAIVSQLVSAPRFEYGTANEINLLSDAADWSNGLVILYTLKPVKKKTNVNQAIGERFSLYMEFLYKTEFDQYTSQNEQYIIQANSLCNEFLIKLEYYRETPLAARYFQIHVNEGMTSLPVYNKLDVNSTGVNLSLELSSMLNQPFNPASRPPGYVPPPNPVAPIVLPPPIYT